jgi:tetratricopeptide (TPR) repeat protein
MSRFMTSPATHSPWWVPAWSAAPDRGGTPVIRGPQVGDQVPPSGGEQVGVGAGEPQGLRLLGREAQGVHRAVVRGDLACAAPRRGGEMLGGPPGQQTPVRVGHVQHGEASRQQGARPPPARIEVAQEPGTSHDAVPAVQARRRYHISASAAASLAGTAIPEARRLLGELARACLTAEHVPGRYAFHDLLRAYAAAEARASDSEPEREAGVGRALDHYLHTADHGSTLLNPTREPVALAPPGPGTAAERPANYQQAMAWFGAEHQVLLAAVTLAAESGFGSHAWQLPWAMKDYLKKRGHYQEWAAIQRTALDTATRLGDTSGQATSSRLLGNACTDLGDHEQARTHLAGSLDLYRRLGNRLGEAKVHQDLAYLFGLEGRYSDALGHAKQALRDYQAIGHKAAEADMLNNVGYYHALIGDCQQARAFCRKALTLSVELGHSGLEGSAWGGLGYAEHHLGHLVEAAACYQRALRISQESGDRWLEATILAQIGNTRHAAGELPSARQAWQQALAIFEDVQHPDADQVRAKLDSADKTSR